MSQPRRASSVRDSNLQAPMPEELKIVDISHVAEKEAKFRAEKIIHAPRETSKNMSRWKQIKKRVKEAPKNIWNSLTKQHQKNKELRRIRSLIEDTGNLYAEGNNDAEEEIENEESMAAILARFDRSYEADDVLTDGEEVQHFSNNETTVEMKELKQKTYELIAIYANGNMHDADFLQEKTRIYDVYFHGGKRPKVSLYADNALDIAKSARQEISHLDKIKEMDVTIGRARSQYKSESVDYTFTDKAVDFLQKNRVTDKIPPSIVSAGVAAAIGATVLAKSTATGLARAATFGIGGGAIIGTTKYFEESKRLKDEKRYVAESEARGEVLEPGAERRKELSAFSLEMMNAEEAIISFKQKFFDGETLREDLSAKEVEEVTKTIGQIEGRIKYNDVYQVDTIAYDASQNGESLHTELMLLRAKTKVELRRKYGITKDELSQQLDSEYLDLLNEIDIERDAKEQAFTDFRRKEALKAGLKGGVKGIVFGAAIQEVTAFFNDSVTGLAESSVDKLFGRATEETTTSTTLEGLKNWITGDTNQIDFLEPNHTAVFDLQDGGSFAVALPEGYEFAEAQTGEIFLTADGIEPIRIEIDHTSGMFDNDTLNRLREAGVQDINARADIDVLTDSNTRHFSIPWSEITEDDVSHIDDLYMRGERPIWLGNDTPGTYEFNERRAYWGGENGSGFSNDGSVEFRIDMREYLEDVQGDQVAGSTQDGIVGGPGAALLDGRIFWEITPERGGPTFQFPFELGADGQVTAAVSPDHPAYDLLFDRGADGDAVLRADIMEIVEQNGNGGDRPFIYASKRGIGELGNLNIEETELTERSVFNNSVDLTQLASGPGDVTPIIPVYPMKRKELERTSRERIMYGGIMHIEAEKRALFDANRSETLNNDPDAVLDHHKETKMYMKKWSKDYRKKIELLQSQLPKMDKETRMSICIPAAGHQEAKNIYTTLENYTYQTADSDSYEITVFVNHPKRDKKGRFMPTDASAGTMSEIERFQKDYPDMKVRVMEMALESEDANIGSIRKMLTDTVLKRHHERGANVDDLIFASNDADNLGVSPRYVKDMLDTFDKYPEKESVLGNLDWDPEAYIRYPEVHVGTRLFQNLNAIGRKRSGRLVTSGANSTYRSSTYSAIGGYLPEISGAEDIAIGQAILAARGETNETYRRVLGYANHAMVYTSARRAIDAWTKYQRPALMQWDKEFTPFDDLRSEELDRSVHIDFDDANTQEKIKTNFESILNQTIDLYEGDSPLGKDADLYKRAISPLGIRYKVDESGILRITDLTAYFDKMKQYQQEAVLIRDRNSGKLEAKRKLVEHKKQEKERKAIEEQETKDEFKREYAEFRTTAIPVLVEGITTSDIESVRTSANTEKIDDVTLDNDQVLKDRVDGKIQFAAVEGDDTVYIAKTNDLDLHVKEYLPDGYDSPEAYISDKLPTDYSDVLVLTKKEKKLGDNKVLRLYEQSGMDINTYMKREKTSFSPKDALGVLIQVCGGLQELHDIGVVHADVKTDNILLDEKGNVRLIDLEDAAIQKHKFFDRSFVYGNRFALPPEMLKKIRTYEGGKGGVVRFGKTVDVYQVGVTMFRMLTGKWPYKFDDLEAKNVPKETDPEYDKFAEGRNETYYQAHLAGDIEFPPEVPPALQSIIKKAMAPHTSARYSSIEALSLDMMKAYKGM